ncbi:MAG TPA: hypothetical protein VFY27_02450 [Woeseiaceae bacterium]|nr:hypothetical protein [Woeseiaceae bacterium]
MNAEELQTHWALLLASVTSLVLLLFAAAHFMQTSARGQLRRTQKALQQERGRLEKAKAVVDKAERQKERLMRNAESVKPRLLRESAEACEDAQALVRIAADRVLVAENHLRRVILEEFPPAQHETLRSRYLPDAPEKKKPFTF